MQIDQDERQTFRRARWLQGLLFSAIFAPTIMALVGNWMAWMFCQLIGVVVVYIFYVNAPRLSKYAKHYLSSQVLGIILGLVLLLHPETENLVLAAWLVLFAIFYLVPFINSVLLLSSNEK